MLIENTVFHNLQRLIWTAFIGVISFQIIAPNVWGYMNKQAGIPYNWAYWIFIVSYALIIPGLTLYWLIKNKAQLGVCLFPFNEEKATGKLCKYLLNAIAWNTGVQVVVCLLFLFGSTLVQIPFGAFAIVQALTLMFCLGLLLIGSNISAKRVQLYNDQVDATANILLKGKLRETIAGCSIVFMVLATWGGTYLYQNGERNYATNSYKADIGFQLLMLKNALHLGNENIAATKDLLAMLDNRDSLNYLGSHPVKVKANTPNPNFAGGADNLLVWGEKTRMAMDTISGNFKKTDTMLKKMLRRDKEGDLAYFTVDSRVSDDSLINRLAFDWQRPGKQQYFDLAVRDSSKALISRLNEGKRQNVYDYALYLESKVKSTAQGSLGIRLRDTQLKLIFMLLGISFPLLALYFFLRIDTFVVSNELEAIGEEKRLTSLQDMSALVKVEEKLLQKEKHQLASANINASIWFILTIGIWLIMPLVKPVEDKEIDTKSPFKMLTFGNPADHVIEIIQRPDVTNHNHFKSEPPDVEEIKTRVRNIETTLCDVKNDVESAKNAVEKTQGKLDAVSGSVSDLNNRVGEVDSVVQNVKGTVDVIRR